MLETYSDTATPEELFDVIQQRFEEVKDEMGHYVKRHKIIQVIVDWLKTLPLDSNHVLLQRVKDFTLSTHNGLIPNAKRKILKVIDDRCRKPISPGRTAELPIKPTTPYDLAVALTLMEGDLYKPICSTDYLLNYKGLPSRIDTLLAAHEKIIQWVKYSVLRHDEMEDTVSEIRRYTKAAQECLRLKNYNSMAAIASVLDWKLKPMMGLPRTLDRLPKGTKASIKELVAIIDPDEHYEAYRMLKAVKANEGNYIPWFSKFTPVHRALIPYLLVIQLLSWRM
ncbi:ras guanine nucleotide exchange factor domain-containing protein [Mycena sp. CBHHK59/15]|nr:ras guanine nucleotide exchange factor domain-containing protein [Mycena sp. CBHHK59/15]